MLLLTAAARLPSNTKNYLTSFSVEGSCASVDWFIGFQWENRKIMAVAKQRKMNKKLRYFAQTWCVKKHISFLLFVLPNTFLLYFSWVSIKSSGFSRKSAIYLNTTSLIRYARRRNLMAVVWNIHSPLYPLTNLLSTCRTDKPF